MWMGVPIGVAKRKDVHRVAPIQYKLDLRVLAPLDLKMDPGFAQLSGDGIHTSGRLAV
jgi:hypothetical protein